MKYNIAKNWTSSFELVVKKPVILLPFIIIGFLESVSLIFLYFATRGPIAIVANPIIKKFFSEAFIHYPGNIIMISRAFYYKQLAIYIFFGALLAAICVNIFKNVKEGLPVKPYVLLKNGMKRYFSYMAYAIMITVLIVILSRLDVFIMRKIVWLTNKIFARTDPFVYFFFNTSLLFAMNLVLQALFVLVIPLMVLEKAGFFKAIAESVKLAVTNFGSVVALIVVPFIIYFPISILKSFSATLADKVFPEIVVLITAAGIILAIFCDCFVLVVMSQFLIDKRKEVKKAL